LRLLFLAFVLASPRPFNTHASAIVTNADEAAIRAAIQAGGTVTLAFDGAVMAHQRTPGIGEHNR
jgi:hypothetical protein